MQERWVAIAVRADSTDGTRERKRADLLRPNIFNMCVKGVRSQSKKKNLKN